MQVYPSDPRPSFSYVMEREYKTYVSDFQSGKEQRRSIWRFPKRMFVLLYKVLTMTDAERNTISDFIEQRRGPYEPFWFFDFIKRKWIDQFVGYGDGTTTTFDLPSKNTDPATLKIYIAGIDKNSIIEVKNSTGSTFNHGDFTNGNAFFWSSIDLSPYAGTDTGYTPYMIELTDNTGKKATGYIGAVGAGETLGSELVRNGTFDSDTEWTKGTGWVIAGGKASKTPGVAASLYQTGVTSSTVFLTKSVQTILDRTAGTLDLECDWGEHRLSINSNGTFTVYFSPEPWAVLRYRADSSFNGSVDDVSLKRVLEPPSTAVHIVSSLNGTTRNWASIESGFDRNQITSWKIFGIPWRFISGGGQGGADRIRVVADIPTMGQLITADFNGQLRIKGRFKDDKFSEEVFSLDYTNISVNIYEVK